VSELPEIHVAAAALINRRGEVLINERPPGKPMAGYWEFPGGKLELGETAKSALVRELHEELGITVEQMRPLIKLQHDYPDKRVHLEVFKVEQWQGEISALDGQALAWVAPADIANYRLLPADAPIVTALRLPNRYLITPELTGSAEEWLAGLVLSIEQQQIRLMQFRQKALTHEQRRALFMKLLPVIEKNQVEVLINDDLELAEEFTLGLHLPSLRMAALDQRPVPKDRYFAASCHNLEELSQAQALGVDFAVLGPVLATASHPNSEPLGWLPFEQWTVAIGIPVYALGGLTLDDLAQIYACGGQGIAAIRGLQMVTTKYDPDH